MGLKMGDCRKVDSGSTGATYVMTDDLLEIRHSSGGLLFRNDSSDKKLWRLEERLDWPVDSEPSLNPHYNKTNEVYFLKNLEGWTVRHPPIQDPEENSNHVINEVQGTHIEHGTIEFYLDGYIHGNRDAIKHFFDTYIHRFNPVDPYENPGH